MYKLIFCFLFSVSTFAADIGFLVKTTSGPCRSINNQMKGSGSIFNYNGATYLLTSEHVVYHSTSEKFCHKISNNDISDERAQLLFADWGSGIALLKLNLPPSEKYLSFPEDFVETPNLDIKIGGSPFSEPKQIVINNGIIQNMKSERMPSAVLKYALEISGTNGEFGMSGGAVFEGDDTHLVYRGLLSHQVLVMKPGNPTSASHWDRVDKNQNQLLAINAIDIKKTLLNYFNNPDEFKISFYRSVLGQISHTDDIIGAGLMFTPILKKSLTERSDTETPIPVGGVDPIGIGGNNQLEGTFTALQVTLVAGAEDFKTYPGIKSLMQNVEKIKSLLLINQKIELPYLFFQEQLLPQNNAALLLSIRKARSIDDFFHLLIDNRNSIVLRNLNMTNYNSLQKKGLENLEYLKHFNINNLKIENQSLFSAVHTISLFAAENNLELINCQFLTRLNGRDKDIDLFWGELMKEEDFYFGMSLLSNIRYFSKTCIKAL
jgi:hypothetical protein